MIPPTWVVFQSLFDATFTLFASKISRVGLASASLIPKPASDGPIARTMIFLVEPAGPWTMKPSIKTLSSVPTGSRVETLATKPGVAVGVGVAAGVAVGVGEAVGAGLAVGVAVGVGVGVGSAGRNALRIVSTI